MLTLIVGGNEYFNEETQEFETRGSFVLEFEHSLISLSKWESKYKKAFLSKGPKTSREIFDYIMGMIITPNVAPDVLHQCTQEDFDQIQEYIDSSESATTFGEMPERRGSGEIITSELIYYWLVLFNIPFECQTWHLNRLFALIRICNVKSSKPKKMTKHEIAMRNRELNAQRRKELNTSG